VLAISLTLHHLPRQSFGGKVHLLGGALYFNCPVFLKAESGPITVTVFHLIAREVKPPARNPQRNIICADLDYCVISAVQSVGRCITAKQGGPGGPKFYVELGCHASFT
jgi:hypothetical protein